MYQHIHLRLCMACNHQQEVNDVVISVADVTEVTSQLIMVERIAYDRWEEDGRYAEWGLHLFQESSYTIDSLCNDKIRQLSSCYAKMATSQFMRHEIELRKAGIPFISVTTSETEPFLVFPDIRLSGLEFKTFQESHLTSIIKEHNYQCCCYTKNCNCQQKSIIVSHFVHLRLYMAQKHMGAENCIISGQDLMKLTYDLMKSWGFWKDSYYNLEVTHQQSLYIDHVCERTIKKMSSE